MSLIVLSGGLLGIIYSHRVNQKDSIPLNLVSLDNEERDSSLNLIYAAIGLGLALYALFAPDSKRGTGAVRQKLTVSGLVAKCFESAERAPESVNEMEN